LPNYYRDNADLLFHFNSMDLSRVIELKEDGFSEKDLYPDAPEDPEDALDNYQRVLDIVGDIAGDYIAPRAAAIDHTGAMLRNGEVVLAREALEILERLKKADLMGFTLPRKYGGLNLPMTAYMAAIEMVSRADASVMLLFGLQGISETISRFGTDDQKERFLPRFCSGEVMGAMALTEPDAGSDLQSAALRADLRPDGRWVLNGVKRFISNGSAEISIVMARSEREIPDGRGLSLFIYERDGNMRIRRLEQKLGIHGSPTCELQFTDAEAELLGKRKFGLIKYTMALLNGARLAVAAQALGIAEAAYRQAYGYANAREQFGKPIRRFAAVYEMLTDMAVVIEAIRSLLYETTRIVDMQDGLEDRMRSHPEQASDIRKEGKRYARLADLLTPILKAYATEKANRICYDAIQIHGGVGYCREFHVEQLYRDVRVTSIYEGTTQLQVVGAIGGILGGLVLDRLNDYEAESDFSGIPTLSRIARQMKGDLERAVTHVKDRDDPVFQEYHSGRLVEMATETIVGYLLCRDALKSQRKRKTAQIYLSKALWRAKAAMEYILSGDVGLIDDHTGVIDEPEDISLTF